MLHNSPNSWYNPITLAWSSHQFLHNAYGSTIIMAIIGPTLSTGTDILAIQTGNLVPALATTSHRDFGTWTTFLSLVFTRRGDWSCGVVVRLLVTVVVSESGAEMGRFWRLRLFLDFIVGSLLCSYILVLACVSWQLIEWCIPHWLSWETCSDRCCSWSDHPARCD